MKVSRLVVPAAATVMLLGGLAAPSHAAPREGLHCADYKSPSKVELSGDSATATVPSNIVTVCIKAGAEAFENVTVVNGQIASPNGKGISYWVPTTYCTPSLCGPSGT